MRVECPHCKSPATVRTSHRLGDTVREARVQCPNLECAHTWVVHVTAVRTIAPSMTPAQGVNIPLSPRSPAAKSPANNQLELGMHHPPPRQY